MSLRSPMGHVLGLGSAKQGVHHWWMQRLTSVALIVLSIWFIAALFSLGRLDYTTLHEWIHAPLNAGLLLLLTVALMYHSQLGLQVVIEDYVAHKGTRVVSIVVNQFAHFALGVLAVLAVLRIAFGSAA
jgi:succinate dehydrogenase / fumarate reductase, membrane anchor subunit